MSLYIHKINQEILWNTITKSSLIYILDNKESWFREIIHTFHDKKGVISDIPTLKTTNRETLQYMISDLYNRNKSIPQHNPMSYSNPFFPDNSTEYMGKNVEKAKKQELYNSAFEERQKQFNELFAKPAVPEVDFSEKLDDEPLTNMEELIEKHRKEREDEIQQSVPSLVPPPS
jgi:hypothetical protein